MPTLVLIRRADPERPQMWFNEYVGRTFPLIKEQDGIPYQYIVDISHIGRWPTSGGRASVPFYFASKEGVEHMEPMGFIPGQITTTLLPVVCIQRGCTGMVCPKDGFNLCARCGTSYGPMSR